LTSSLVVGRYKSIDVRNLRQGYREPFVVIIGITNNKNGHSMRPNKVTLKYPNFKKNVNANVHVRVFNFAMKANAKTFEEYIINAFSYTLKDTTSNWCHNYMLKFLDCTFLELT
jgi:hypothetical protein